MLGLFAGFAQDFFDDDHVAVGEEGGLGEAGAIVFFRGVGSELVEGGARGFADDSRAGGEVADALCLGGGDDSDDGGDAHEEGDVEKAQRPAEEAVPESELAAVGADNPEFEDGFAEASAVEKEFAKEVVEGEKQPDENQVYLFDKGIEVVRGSQNTGKEEKQ